MICRVCHRAVESGKPHLSCAPQLGVQRGITTDPDRQPINVADVRAKLTANEQNLLEVADTWVVHLREQLVQETLSHELTRGDLRKAEARIRELEALLGIIEAPPSTEPAVRSAEMRAAKKEPFDA